MQHKSVYYSATSLYMFRVSTTPIISSTQNCKYSLRYRASTSLRRGQAWLGHVGGRWMHKKYASTSLQRGEARLGHAGGRWMHKKYDQYRRL